MPPPSIGIFLDITSRHCELAIHKHKPLPWGQIVRDIYNQSILRMPCRSPLLHITSIRLILGLILALELHHLPQTTESAPKRPPDPMHPPTKWMIHHDERLTDNVGDGRKPGVGECADDHGPGEGECSHHDTNGPLNPVDGDDAEGDAAVVGDYGLTADHDDVDADEEPVAVETG